MSDTDLVLLDCRTKDNDMTVFSFIKFAFACVSLMAFVFLGVGAWKVWSAYNFAKTAVKVQGTFIGYHEVLRDSTVTDSHGFKTKVSATYPMFAYTDAAGRTHHITGTEVVVFRWLKNGDPVDVLVSPDDPENARLGSMYYLYGDGGFSCLGGFFGIVLLFYGFKVFSLYLGPSAEISETIILAALQSFLRSKLPVGDLAFICGGFILLAGLMFGFGTYFILKRQDPALIQAMEAGRFEEARLLASQGKGIEGKNEDGEPALIVALKANKSEVARAILGHWISTNVVTSKGVSGISLAAANGDHHTLALMVKKGAETFGLHPSIVHRLIVKGDTGTLGVIFSSSFNLDTEYKRLTFGDHAVMHAKADVVRLIQQHHGPFKAPPAFIALVLDDMNMLTTALKEPNACHKIFQGFTLVHFAEIIGKQEMMEKAGAC